MNRKYLEHWEKLDEFKSWLCEDKIKGWASCKFYRVSLYPIKKTLVKHKKSRRHRQEVKWIKKQNKKKAQQTSNKVENGELHQDECDSCETETTPLSSPEYTGSFEEDICNAANPSVSATDNESIFSDEECKTSVDKNKESWMQMQQYLETFEPMISDPTRVMCTTCNKYILFKKSVMDAHLKTKSHMRI